MRDIVTTSERDTQPLMGLRLGVVKGAQEGCTGWVRLTNDFMYTPCGDAHVLLSCGHVDNENGKNNFRAKNPEDVCAWNLEAVGRPNRDRINNS